MITQIVQSEIKFDAHQDIISVVVYHHSTKYIIKSDYLVLYNKINPSVIIPRRNPIVMLSELVEKYINEPGVIYDNYIPVIGSNELEFLLGERKEYKKIMKQYALDHALCPKCGSESHSTTYVGYILHMDRKDEYKDLNRCVCSNCGDVHTTHDRVK